MDKSATIGGTRGEMEPDEGLAGLLVTYMLNRSLLLFFFLFISLGPRVE